MLAALCAGMQSGPEIMRWNRNLLSSRPERGFQAASTRTCKTVSKIMPGAMHLPPRPATTERGEGWGEGFTLLVFLLPRPAMKERGEGRGEGCFPSDER